MNFNIVGKWLIAVGVVIALYALSMPVSISGSEVVNIHLITERQNILIIGGVIFLAGIVFYAALRIRETTEEAKPVDSHQQKGDVFLTNEKESDFSSTSKTLLEKLLCMLQKFCSVCGVHRLAEAERFLNKHRVIVAIAIAIMLAQHTWAYIKYYEHVRLAGWLSLFALFLSLTYTYFGGNIKNETPRRLKVENTENNKKELDVGENGFRIDAAVYRLIFLVFVLWFYNIRISDTHVSGKYLALIPLLILLLVGLHIKSRKMVEFYKVSMIASILGLLFVARSFWVVSTASSIERLNSFNERMLQTDYSIVVPRSIDFALVILFLSVIIPTINRSSLFGFRYGFHKYDFKFGHDDLGAKLPLYTAFVYGLIISGCYEVLSSTVSKVIGVFG